MPKVKVIGPRDPKPEGLVINTTSRSTNWSKGLSPFFLGPCNLYRGHSALRMENAWQFSKVYSDFIAIHGDPTPEYFSWAISGWNSSWAKRYPMGKNKKPLYSYWDGQNLDMLMLEKVYMSRYITGQLKTLKLMEG